MIEFNEEKSADIRKPYEFIFGGNAWFTISNPTTGKYFHYFVRKNPKNENMYFVKCSNKKGNWRYAGCLIKTSKEIIFARGANGECEKDSPEIRGIFYALKHGDNILPNPMVMHHHGKCARCGRVLTDKLSVERGFGPKCFDEI